MSFKLFKHQKNQNKKTRKLLTKYDHVLYGATTGFGKSDALWDLIKNDLKNDERVLVLAPYRKLIFQLEQTFATYQPHIVMGTIDRGSNISGLVLASMDTMNNRMKKGSKYFEGFDKIYIDEAHISCNFPPEKTSRMKLLYDKYWHTAKWVGFTATPIKANGYRLEGWDKTIYKYQTAKLIEMGYLADYYYYAPKDIDLSKMRTNSLGEYVAEDIEEVTNTPTAVKSVKKIWKKYGKNKKKVLIFASSINHAELLKDSIKGSFVIHSKMKEIDQQKILDDFKISSVGTLINVGMLTTGFDDPTVDMLIIARPIRSVRLFIQVAGRALRKYEDKVSLIFDMCSVYQNCGLPKDIRDFNRVKGEVVQKNEAEDTVMRCDLCNEVSPRNTFSIKKRVTKKSIIQEFTCPACEQMCKETRVPLAKAENVGRVDEIEVKKLSFKERKEIVGNLVEEFTRAKKTWSHYIVTAINTTGRTELLEQAIAKGTTDKTLWKKVMDLFSDAKEDLK